MLKTLPEAQQTQGIFCFKLYIWMIQQEFCFIYVQNIVVLDGSGS